MRAELGLWPVVNVSGTMTSLGASIVVPEAVRAVAGILPQFVEVNDLQRKASAVIARLCGSEAGFVTASAAAGITLAIAGCMTGADLARIERLPDASWSAARPTASCATRATSGCAPFSRGRGRPADSALGLIG